MKSIKVFQGYADNVYVSQRVPGINVRKEERKRWIRMRMVVLQARMPEEAKSRRIKS